MTTDYWRCVNMVVQLPDKRILLHRPNGNARWSMTIERYISLSESPLGFVNDILWNLFGIDPFSYNDNFAEIKRYPPTKGIQDKNIIVYIMKLKSAIAFQAKPTDQFKAIQWDTLLKEIMRNSIYVGYNSRPEHTPNSIIVAKELHIKEVF
jgi:hypothetical protein